MLSNDEALAIMLSLLTARRQGIGVEPHLIEGALAKIERVLPDSLRLRLQAVQAAVDFVAEPTAPHPSSETLLSISMAVRQQQRLHLRYQSPVWKPNGMLTRMALFRIGNSGTWWGGVTCGRRYASFGWIGCLPSC